MFSCSRVLVFSCSRVLVFSCPRRVRGGLGSLRVGRAVDRRRTETTTKVFIACTRVAFGSVPSVPLQLGRRLPAKCASQRNSNQRFQHTFWGSRQSMSRKKSSSRDRVQSSDSDSDEVASPSKHSKSSQPIVIFRTSLHNTIFDVMRSRTGWEETDSDTDWDINWASVGWVREFFDHVHMDDHQRINHFRNHYELTRKDLMVKNLKRMKRQLERTDTHAEASKYNFFPATFVLPAEYGLFLEEFKRTPGSTWIMKPVGSAQGKGIFLFNKLNQISDWKKDHKWKADGPQAEAYVAQRYIESPYLIGGKKFDMRLYLLVTSFSPLVCWLHRGGFCRFSDTTFTKDISKDIDNLYMHLTNHSIQKQSDEYEKGNDLKWSIRSLKVHLMTRHGKEKVEQAFYDIQLTMVRTLLAVQKTMIQDKHCFELYGYDIMLDSELNNWLIEVNASPSLSASNEDDYALKYGMLDDMVDIIDVEGNRSGEDTRLGGFDLIWNNGPCEPNIPGRTPNAKAGKSGKAAGGSLSRSSAAIGVNHQLASVTPFSFLGCKIERDKVAPRGPPPKSKRR